MGHRSDEVWNYTPRQIRGFLALARDRRRGDAAEALAIGTMAARGEPGEVKARIREWTRGGRG